MILFDIKLIRKIFINHTTKKIEIKNNHIIHYNDKINKQTKS